MQRLTHYYNGKVAEPRNRSEAQAMAQKLAEYEDAEEKGLLVKLPCKVGDTVWLKGGIKATVTSFYHAENSSIGNCWLTVKCNGCKNNTKRICLPISEFGKTVFLAPAAQQGLKERDKDA